MRFTRSRRSGPAVACHDQSGDAGAECVLFLCPADACGSGTNELCVLCYATAGAAKTMDVTFGPAAAYELLSVDLCVDPIVLRS